MAACLIPFGWLQIATAAPPITAVAFTADGTQVVAGSQAGLEVRSWPRLENIAKLPTQLVNLHDLAFSPDGGTLAAVGGQPGVGGAVELYRWSKQELLGRIAAHDDVVYAVAWQSEGKQIALASGDQRVSLLDAGMAAPPRYFEGHSRAVLAVTFLPGDEGLVSGAVDESIRWWDLVSGSPRRVLANHTRAVSDLKVRPARAAGELTMLASAGEDRTVRFWQPTIGRLVRFVRLESAASALAWTADGEHLWAACRDGRLRQIDFENATVTLDLPAIDGVAYTLAIAPDANIAVGGSNAQLRRIDPRDVADSNKGHMKQ